LGRLAGANQTLSKPQSSRSPAGDRRHDIGQRLLDYAFDVQKAEP
jgi:hypothetical protein